MWHQGACGLDVKEEVLEGGSKTSKGVNYQMKQDHVVGQGCHR